MKSLPHRRENPLPHRRERGRFARRTIALAVAACAVGSTPAAADPCGSFGPLPDGDGRVWERLGGGGLRTQVSDAFDAFAVPTYDRSRDRQWDDVDPGFPEGCTQPTGTEVAYPARLDPLSGLEVSHVSHVSAATDAFVRVVTVLHNPTAAARAFDLWSWNSLDAGNAVDVVTSSDGNGQGTAADDWLVAGTPGGAHVALVWQDADTRRRESARHVVDFGDSSPPDAPVGDTDPLIDVHFATILAPGETKAFMLLGAARPTAAAAQAEALQLAAGPDQVFAGIEPAVLAAVQNWVVPDADADGIANEDDGCPYLADPQQPDADGDAQNDGCDADDDNDGLSDAVEGGLGTSPTAADTDGDGARDDVDGCPRTAGTDGGCPAVPPPLTTTVTTTTTVPGPPVVVEAPVDRTAPNGRFVGAAARMKPAAFRRGVPCRVATDEPAALTCRLLVKPRAARLAAAGDLELASASAALGAGERTVRLRPAARLVRGAKRLRVVVEAVLTDASGNRATLRRTIAVR